VSAAPPAESQDREFFDAIDSHRVRGFIRFMRALPGEPRCTLCRAPFGGIGARVVRPFGFAPSRKNPRLCASCFEKAPDGSSPLDIGVLFADVRGFTTFAEQHDPRETTEVLNRFYAAAVDVLCRHAIIDKLVGDEVMALYLPQLLGDDAAEHMVEDAQELLARVPDELDVGVGLAYGRAMVGNVGSGDVKDFTAIGDVVNTCARLQGAAAAGEIVASRRVIEMADCDVATAEPRVLTLKGKSRPEEVVVFRLPAPPG
jgi:adenylate cyclase